MCLLTIRTQDDALPGKAPNGSQQAITIARCENGILAIEVANDALLRTAVLTDVLNEVEIGIAVDNQRWLGLFEQLAVVS